MKVLVMALLAFATSAFAQKTTAAAAPLLGSLAADAQTTAFFYQRPVVLDSEQHKGLRIKPADARFAAKSQAVPLLLSEFSHASLEYPIVFFKGQDGQWLALALTGLSAGVNAFVDSRGQWNARYVPASVRRYPFILAQGQGQQLSLAADLAAPQLGMEGELLFDERGQPTDFTKQIMKVLLDFEGQARATAHFVKQLEDAGLLVQQNLQVRLGDGRSAAVDGVWIVDESKLRQLNDAKVLTWFRSGELMALHAQMFSLRNLASLLDRSEAKAF